MSRAASLPFEHVLGWAEFRAQEPQLCVEPGQFANYLNVDGSFFAGA